MSNNDKGKQPLVDRLVTSARPKVGRGRTLEDQELMANQSSVSEPVPYQSWVNEPLHSNSQPCGQKWWGVDSGCGHGSSNVSSHTSGDIDYDEYNDDGDGDGSDHDNEDDSHGDDDGDTSSLGSRRRMLHGSGGRRGGRRRNVSGHDSDWRLREPLVGGPLSIDLLYGYNGHIASAIWQNQDRPLISIHTRYDRIHTWKRIQDQHTLTFVNESGLNHLGKCMFKHLNTPLIAAFVERWHPETNSFHMPFGEMTITLHDVHHILRIPTMGTAVTHSMGKEELQAYIASQLQMSLDDVKSDWRRGMKFKTIFEKCEQERLPSPNRARGYLMYLLGATLFIDKSQDRFSPQYMPFLIDLHKVNQYAWGAACLVYLYRQLGMASRIGCKQMAGCTSLLEAWIYEYFPMFRPAQDEHWSSALPRAMKWKVDRAPEKLGSSIRGYRMQLDQLKTDDVIWMPYGSDVARSHRITLFHGCLHCLDIREPYMPDRVLRQFGYVQTVPKPPIKPRKCALPVEPKSYVMKYEHMISNWMNLSSHTLRSTQLGHPVTRPGETTPNYLQWFEMMSHPRVQNPEYIPQAYVPPQHMMTDSARLQLARGYLRPLYPDMRESLALHEVWEVVDHVIAAVNGIDIGENVVENRRRKRKQ